MIHKIIARRLQYFRVTKRTLFKVSLLGIIIFIINTLQLHTSIGKSSRREIVRENSEKRCYPNIYGTKIVDPSKRI